MAAGNRLARALVVVVCAPLLGVCYKKGPPPVSPMSCLPTNKSAIFRQIARPQADADRVDPLSGEPWIDIGFFDTRKGIDARTLRQAAAGFNTSSRVRFHLLLLFPQPVPGFNIVQIQFPKYGRCLYGLMSKLAHGPGPQYLYKPLAHMFMPANISRLILVDADVLMVGDVTELYAEFDRMGPDAVLAVAREQTFVYNPHVGLNGGVQLLDLDKMRSSTAYHEAVDWVATGRYGKWIGFLGDQTLYVWLHAMHPAMVHILPCRWNRQLSSQPKFVNQTLHACSERCGILHANEAHVKCVAHSMAYTNRSCTAWNTFQERMGTPELNCPYSKRQKNSNLRRHHALRLQVAIRAYFADCCIPDGSPDTKHIDPRLPPWRRQTTDMSRIA